MEEIWKNCDIYADPLGEISYEISNMGRFRRIKNTDVKYISGHKIKDYNGKKKKPRIQVILSYRGEIKTKMFLHRLVALAFCENPNKKETVNHIDCDTLNNRADNLEWMTQEENNAHKMVNGLFATGKEVWNNKANPDEVLQMRKNGCTLVAISKKIGVDRNAIKHMLINRNMLWPDGVNWTTRQIGQRYKKNHIKSSAD